MNIASINYTNRHNNLPKTVPGIKNNQAFSGKLMTDLRIKRLDKQYINILAKSNGYNFLERTIDAIIDLFRKNSITQFKQKFNAIKDKDGNIPKDVYKICNCMIAHSDCEIDKIVNYLNKFKNTDGSYDKNKTDIFFKVPLSCIYGVPIIIEETPNMSDDMQREIFKICKIYDKKLNPTLKNFISFIQPTYTAGYGAMTDINHGIEPSFNAHHYWPERKDIPIRDVLSSIKDTNGQPNMTLIKAVKAIIKYGNEYDRRDLEQIMKGIVGTASRGGYEEEQKHLSKIFKKAGLTLDEVADAKNINRIR